MSVGVDEARDASWWKDFSARHPLIRQFTSPAIYNILITVINGGVQMVIYFPIYKIIFPTASEKSDGMRGDESVALAESGA